MTNLDSVLKSRDITLLTKVHIVKPMVFPEVTYGCERWTIKKVERRRMDAFELWCWRRLLRVPWTARRLNQSILREINPEYSLEGLMLKLKLQYFGISDANSWLIWKVPDAGKDWEQKRVPEDGCTTSAVELNVCKLREMARDRESWHATVHRGTKSQPWLGNWKKLPAHPWLELKISRSPIKSFFWKNYCKAEKMSYKPKFIEDI